MTRFFLAHCLRKKRRTDFARRLFRHTLSIRLVQVRLFRRTERRSRTASKLTAAALQTSALPDEAKPVLGSAGTAPATTTVAIARSLAVRPFASPAATTVFVVVKTRVGAEFGGGAAALTAWKQRRVTQMAVDYLARHRLHDRPCRFDVVTIEMDDGRPRIQVYAHAFDATD